MSKKDGPVKVTLRSQRPTAFQQAPPCPIKMKCMANYVLASYVTYDMPLSVAGLVP